MLLGATVSSYFHKEERKIAACRFHSGRTYFFFKTGCLSSPYLASKKDVKIYKLNWEVVEILSARFAEP